MLLASIVLLSFFTRFQAASACSSRPNNPVESKRPHERVSFLRLFSFQVSRNALQLGVSIAIIANLPSFPIDERSGTSVPVGSSAHCASLWVSHNN